MRVEQSFSYGQDIARPPRNSESRVAEERDFSVRMCNSYKEVGHGDQALAHPSRSFLAIQLLNQHRFQVVLKHDRVIHGAALLMTAVLQDLFLQPAPKQPFTGFVPPCTGFAPQKTPAKTSALAFASK